MLKRSKPSRRDRALGLLPGRRVVRRNPVLAALGDADQAVLRFLRTRGHAEPVETAMKTLGMAGEFGAVWAGIGTVGASVDERRRGQYLVAGLVGPLAVGLNYVIKRGVGRERPLIEDHPLTFVPSLNALAALAERAQRSDGAALVLADPEGDLPQAAEEGRSVAARLGDVRAAVAAARARFQAQ